MSVPTSSNTGRQAMTDGVAEAADEAKFREQLRAYVWEPVYLPYERVEDHRRQ